MIVDLGWIFIQFTFQKYHNVFRCEKQLKPACNLTKIFLTETSFTIDITYYHLF